MLYQTSNHLPHASLSRRQFLCGAAAAWATVSILPGRLQGAAGQMPPGKQVTLGFIGVGDRGGIGPTGGWSGLLPAFMLNAKCRVLAVCDVHRLRAEQCKAYVDKQYGNRDCAMYRDFRELLSRDDIDAVVIATPTHWHAVMTIMACQHGKDVYCEKPLAYSVRQGRAMVEAARRYGRVVQTGTQARSSRKQQFICRLIREGKLKLKQILCGGGKPRVSTLFRAPAQPVPEYLDWDLFVGPAEWRPYHEGIYDKFGWRSCVNFGSYSGPDLTAHTFDVAQSALGMDLTGPVEVHPPTDNERKIIALRYANGAEIKQQDDKFAPQNEQCGMGLLFDCEEGQIRIAPWDDAVQFDPPALAARFLLPEKSSSRSEHINYCSAHYNNFLDCIRTRRKPNADVEIGQRSLTVTHLACIGYQLNRPLRWDPVKEDFVNNPEASRYLNTALQAPWRI